MKTRAWLTGCLWALLVSYSVPVVAQTAPDSTSVPSVDLLDTLADLSCKESEEVFYRQTPRYVYDDQSDQLYEMLLYLADRCEYGEPLGRIQILASIWDGNFQEIIYGYEVIGWLADRYDPDKQPQDGSARAEFDTFTVDFASQMLPHLPPGSIEEFYCLFYTGQTDQAWQMLQSDTLDDTWLRYYYDEEIDNLTRTEAPYVIGVHWGGWQPGGDMEFVGRKQLIGASVEQNVLWGFWRVVVEGRVGRSDEPYYVDENGVSGYSDRWDALLVGVEAGLPVWQTNAHMIEVFLGLGYDGVHPFKDEEITPASVNVNFGAGYRWYPDRSKRWFLRVDGRYEFIGERNKNGTPLGGSAISARLGLGFSLGKNPEPRLQLLGHTP